MSEHRVIYDDFTGFTFNGIHCSQFGLLRVSDGDRYEDDLVLSLSNEATDVPGGVGQYYWGENIKQRTFKINVAYDTVTEQDKRAIRNWLHPDDKLHELIFDEKPYVKYWVKCSKQVTAKELCFNEEGKRIYKGEFDIEFTAYMPYGINRWKFLPADYETMETPEEYGNISEWAEVSGLIEKKEYDNAQMGVVINQENSFSINCYNPGDVESDFVFQFTKPALYNEITFRREAAKSKGWVKKESGTFLNTTEKYWIPSGENGLLQEIKIEDNNLNNVTYDNDTKTGYIEYTNGVPRFVSDTTGDVFNIYCEEETVIYKVNNIDINNNQLIYGLDKNNNIVEFFALGQTTESGITYTRASITSGGGLPLIKLYLINPTQSIFTFKLKIAEQQYKDYFIQFSITSNNNISPKYWSEAQKMLFLPCQIRIDTNKKVIQYREIISSIQGLYGNWVGVNGMIADGDFFKIPKTTEKVTFQLENGDFCTGLTELSLTYPYLYF